MLAVAEKDTEKLPIKKILKNNTRKPSADNIRKNNTENISVEKIRIKNTDNLSVKTVRGDDTADTSVKKLSYNRHWERRTRRMELKLPPSMYEEIKSMAKDHNVTLNEFIILMLEKHVL
jgi:hypothetical protein